MCLPMNAAPVAEKTTAARHRHKRLVLFYRDFQAFSGGHLKVWDYFNHVLSSGTHEPRIAFSAQSKWDAANPWLNFRSYVTDWEPHQADVLFLAGTDWRAMPKSNQSNFQKPVINLIQHPRHADPHSELRRFLRNRAVRICVSEEVADTITKTGEVEGPVVVIPNAIDLRFVPPSKPWNERSIDILICGLKENELAREVRAALRTENCTIKCLTEWLPRGDFLDQMSNAKVTIFLPRSLEGFYLPALEGMAAGTIVICPDCFGNRGFCDDTLNCFRPEYAVNQIVAAAHRALQQAEDERMQMLDNARMTARRHSLEQERKRFSEILEQIDQLWVSNSLPTGF
jgi:Glycosyl transferases group 1